MDSASVNNSSLHMLELIEEDSENIVGTSIAFHNEAYSDF